MRKDRMQKVKIGVGGTTTDITTDRKSIIITSNLPHEPIKNTPMTNLNSVNPNIAPSENKLMNSQSHTAEQIKKNRIMKNQDSKNSSIIDFIVAEQKKKKNELTAIVDENKTVIDNLTFFIENFEFGLAKKTEFLTFIGDDTLAMKQFQSFIQMMTEGRKLNYGLPYSSKDGNDYYYIKVPGSGGDLEIKIKSVTWIDKLLYGYTFSKYTVQLDLQGLYEEATRIAD